MLRLKLFFLPPTTVYTPLALQRTTTVVKQNYARKQQKYPIQLRVGQLPYEFGAQCAISRRSFICTGIAY